MALSASRRLLVLDYFRVPYSVGRWTGLDHRGPFRLGRLAAGASGPALLWVTDGFPPGAGSRHALDGLDVYTRVVPDERVASSLGRSWRRTLPVTDGDGHVVSHVLESDAGDVLLPFDPDEAILNLWSERYLRLDRGAARLALAAAARRSYYRLRPVLPRVTQIAIRRRFSRTRSVDEFPRWPVETALHDLYAFLLGLCARMAGRPIPAIGLWPSGHSWAVVLTHDVETDVGYRNLHRLRDPETDLGYRSSWNFVPGRYHVDDKVVTGLTEDGHEVGVHGLRHDGRDLGSHRTFRRRLPEIGRYADRWGAAGFRAPATQRNWDWMRELPFDYDSSYPDSDAYEPQPGGCCSWLPIENGPLVELPITLPQDHTLFTILGQADATAWIEKASYLRERGGMALMITHPDYALEGPLEAAYRTFLERFADDADAWKALPRDVSAWWRRRAASSLERLDDHWQIVGPASAEATIVLHDATPALGSHSNG